MLATPENRWHLLLPNLTVAMLYHGKMERGLELAERIDSPAVRRAVFMAQAHVLFHRGDLAGARHVLEQHGNRTDLRVSEVAGWAYEAYERGDARRGDTAVELAGELLREHAEATDETVSSATLPQALAASGDVDGAIEMVRGMSDSWERASAGILVAQDLASGPDADRGRALLEEAAVWRKELGTAGWSLTIGEGWAWLRLGETARALNLVNSFAEPERRDGMLALLVLEAGRSGNAEAALSLADAIAADDAKAKALAWCAQQAFVSGHGGAAMACLEPARAIVARLLTAVADGGIDADARSDIDEALGAAANAESLAGNDAAVAEIVAGSGIYGLGMVDDIIAAHIDAGEYTLAMLIVFQNSNSLRQAKALSYLARTLALQEFYGD